MKLIIASTAVAMVLFGTVYNSYITSTPNPIKITTGQPLGVATMQAQSDIINWLLTKPGGYTANDMLPPTSFADNMPYFETGVVKALRDVALIDRNHFSRAQSQSEDDRNVVKAQTSLNIDTESWMMPSAEGEYETAMDEINKYIIRLKDANSSDGNFYVRSTDIAKLLEMFGNQMGSYTQRLSQANGNVSSSNSDSASTIANESTKVSHNTVTTGYFEVDDNFYETMGYTWAVSQLLKAIKVDFVDVLNKKNGVPTLDNAIRELEKATQFSFYVFNGGWSSNNAYSLIPNYSLILSSYVSRSNQALDDLAYLLLNG